MGPGVYTDTYKHLFLTFPSADDPNTGPARSGTASVAGHTVTLLQDAVAPTTCVFALSPKSTSLPVAGGTLTIAVTVVQGTACAWTALPIGDGLTILSGAQGVGPGAIVLAVAPNPGTARFGSVYVGTERAEFTQPEAPGGCVYTVAPPSFSLSATAHEVFFDVILSTGSTAYCQFSVSQRRDDPMLRTLSLTPSGNTTRVVLGVTENTTPAPRSSSVIIAGLATPITVMVNQAGRTH